MTVLAGEYPADGWAIPTRELLQDMYSELYAEGLGSFSAARYWSTDIDDTYDPDFYYTVDLSEEGFFEPTHPENSSLARPYRTFVLL